MRRPDQALSRNALLEAAWDMAYENRSNVIDVYVRYLREKIDRPFGCGSLETVRGVGYRLSSERVLSALPIRVRLAAGFAVAMAAVLVGLGIFVYFRVGDALLRSVDESLRGAGGEIRRLTASGGSLIDADVRESGTIVEVLDANGRVIRSAPTGLPPLIDRPDDAASARNAQSDRDRVPRLRASRTTGGRSRSRSAAGVIVVARSLRQREETLHHVFRVLLIAGPLGLLLATIGGYLLAAAALRPVESMRRRASAISAETVAARLAGAARRDEVRRLAETLNEMLARLEASFAHERRFVADASHELRTPLALLKTELELALRRERTAERAAAPRSSRPPSRPTG